MAAKNNSLEDRIKNNYENRSKTYLTRRTPVMIRLDGKAFHTFTKNLRKPYDELFHMAMNKTLLYLCENIQGCKLGYTQSDEISLILIDYDTLTTDAWFNYNVQKMVSVAASMATLEFNRAFENVVDEFVEAVSYFQDADLEDKYLKALASCVERGAMFDARCFNIPEDEITNAFIWRQQDATRNAIQMLGQAHFSHKELQGKSNSDIQDMLMIQKGVNFNDMATEFKRGVCCIKDENSKWFIDANIPIFSQCREYIEDAFRRSDDCNE